MKKKPVRPPGRPSLPADEQTKPRSIRLTDARWEKLKRLKSEWLNKAIDKAKESPPIPQSLK